MANRNIQELKEQLEFAETKLSKIKKILDSIKLAVSLICQYYL
jgi:flagellin-like hook-associated protein FlgL